MQPGDLWTQVRNLRGDVSELQDKVLDLEAKLDLEHDRAQMMAAHVENLIDRVADLEGTPRTKRAWEGRHGGLPEPTATDTPVSPPPAGDKNPAGW